MKSIEQETLEALAALFEGICKTTKDMIPNKFYMIYVEGQDSPKRQHLTYHDAKKEAERLARLMHKKTYILGTIECLEVNDIISTKCNVSEIPF